jgi:hypothetical protein
VGTDLQTDSTNGAGERSAEQRPPEPAWAAEQPAASIEAPRPKRAYRLRKPFRMTPARRAASRANAAKAREAQQARGWPRSELQRAAARLNLRKALQARRKHPKSASALQLASARANLVKALEVLRARGWAHSDLQRAASRANLRKAQAANRRRDRLTPRQRLAVLANFAKASARLQEIGYVRTERRLAACRANLLKAWKVSHDPKNYGLIYACHLKHGLDAHRLDELMMEYCERRLAAREARKQRRLARLAAP